MTLLDLVRLIRTALYQRFDLDEFKSNPNAEGVMLRLKFKNSRGFKVFIIEELQDETR
jgi:hypothetical protein